MRRIRTVLSLLALALTIVNVQGQTWFTDPCQYHPQAIHQLRHRFESIVGQKYATDTIYAHLQRHIEQYESSRLNHRDHDLASAPHKPLVLSFHGPTGTGKSLTANSVAHSLFYAARSSHVHTYHGADFSSPDEVQQSVSYLKSEFAQHVRRCPLSLFIIEEIHLMAPGVLDGLRHLMDAQAPNSRFKIPTDVGKEKKNHPAAAASPANLDSLNDISDTTAGNTGASSSTGSGSTSVALNFAHVIWLFTTNIGSSQVQEVAYDAAKNGLSRESISPVKLHDMLFAALEHSEQLQLLRDASVLSALVPFFPLFKSHVKECATVQLVNRRKTWLMNGQLASFEWDSTVPAYASSQLKYRGPISIYGCKNVHELLTSVMLAPLTREFKKEQEEADHILGETLRDARVPKRKKAVAYGWNLLQRAKQFFTGPVWSLGQTNVTMSVETRKDGAEEIVFVLETPQGEATSGASSASTTLSIHRTEIRQIVHAAPANLPDAEDTRRRKNHDHMMDGGANNDGTTIKDEL